MKNFILSLCLLSSFDAAIASNISCQQRIENKFEKKLNRLESYMRNTSYPRFTAVFGTQVLAPLAGVLIAPPLYLVVGGLALGYSIYDVVTLDNKTEKIRTLNDLIDGEIEVYASNYLNKTLRQAREVKPDAEMVDVLESIQRGIVSEELCSGLFITPKKIQKYIIDNI